MNYTDEEYQEMKGEIRVSSNWNEEYIKKVVEISLEKGYPVCGAKARSTGEPCRNRQSANGRCAVPQHKGSSGPKNPEKLKKNKNAVTHGGYETIWASELNQKDKDYVLNTDEIKTIKALDAHMKLIDIRIRDMLARIRELTDGELSLTAKEIKQQILDKSAFKETKEKFTSNSEMVDKTLSQIDRWQRTFLRMAKAKEDIKSGGGIDWDKIEKFLSGSDIFNDIKDKDPEDLDIPDIAMPGDGNG